MDMPADPADTILNLANEYNTGRMIVRNISDGRMVILSADPRVTVERYNGKIYGYYKKAEWKNYSRDSKEIYGAFKHDWVVDWFAN